ncbi:MAG: LCP family protein [Patescibacteria group bacterium]
MLNISNIVKNNRVKKFLFGLFFLIIFLASASAGFLYLNFKKVFVNGPNGSFPSPSPPISDPYAPYNILLLGYGGEGHQGGTLADSLIVAHIQPKKMRVTLISVPRDTWVLLPIRSDIRQNYKINASYAIGSDDIKYALKEPQYKGEAGGGEMAKYAVNQVTGLPIDYFISISFDGFRQAIDILGGVEVDVPVAFVDNFYPIKGRENDTCGKSAAEINKLQNLYSDTKLHQQFECRYEQIQFDAGKKLMDGETALKFARSRASAQHGGDFARSQRQQEVLLGIKDKIISIGALDDIVPFINKIADTVRTDMDVAVISQLLETQGSPGEYEIQTVNLSEENVFVSSISTDGQFILIPKEGDGIFSGVHTYIKEQIGK